MWDCPACKCKNIAGDLTSCPMCYKEREMPRATIGGASNQHAQPGEPGYVEPEVEETKAEPVVDVDAQQKVDEQEVKQEETPKVEKEETPAPLPAQPQQAPTPPQQQQPPAPQGS